MPRKFFRKYLPDPEAVRSSRMVAAFGGWLQHPNLWHLNRRSVPGAVAIGLACGLVPGPLQMLAALLIAIPLPQEHPGGADRDALHQSRSPSCRSTCSPIPTAGWLLPGEQGPFIAPFAMDWSDLPGSLRALGEWMMALGKPLGVGLLALA